MDFSKAFDTVSHSVLLDKLVAYNCPQFLISWLTNFLTGRYKSVVSLFGFSSKLSISRSIIQGSGIGPAAFLAIIGDLHPTCMSTLFSKYADDLTVVFSGSAVSHAGNEIDNVVQWSAKNKLRLKMSKTKEIVLYNNGNKKVALPPTICNIEQVDAVKLLGVCFNCRLSFSGYIDNVLSIVNQRLYLINQLQKQRLDSNGLNIVFNSLVSSRLTYACQAFSGFLSEFDLNRLQSCLNKACRWKLCSVRHDIR
jgi:ribonucleases P/MRP protein subunit RPP40